MRAEPAAGEALRPAGGGPCCLARLLTDVGMLACPVLCRGSDYTQQHEGMPARVTRRFCSAGPGLSWRPSACALGVGGVRGASQAVCQAAFLEPGKAKSGFSVSAAAFVPHISMTCAAGRPQVGFLGSISFTRSRCVSTASPQLPSN